MAHPSQINARRSAIAAVLKTARNLGYVIIQSAPVDFGERRDAWAEIEDGSYPLDDLDTLVDLLRERNPPPGISAWATAMAAAPLPVQEIERHIT